MINYALFIATHDREVNKIVFSELMLDRRACFGFEAIRALHTHPTTLLGRGRGRGDGRGEGEGIGWEGSSTYGGSETGVSRE